MRSFVAWCFQHFEKRCWWDDGIPFLITIPDCPRFLFIPERMEINFFSKLLLKLLNLFLSTPNWTFFFHMTHLHTFYLPSNFYDTWSIASWSTKLAIFHFVIHMYVLFKISAWSPQQLHWIEFSKFQNFGWLLGMFVRARPFFGLELFW